MSNASSYAFLWDADQGPDGPVSDDRKEEFDAYYAHPGDLLRIVPEHRLVGEDEAARRARLTLLGSASLKVEVVRVTRARAGLAVFYCFEGIEGEHDASAFEDSRGIRHVTGILVSQDGRTWIMPVSDEGPPTLTRPQGKALPIAQSLGRTARIVWGLDDDAGMISAFFAERAMRPLTGHFALCQNPDDAWEISHSAWTQETLPQQTAFMVTAFSTATAPDAPVSSVNAGSSSRSGLRRFMRKASTPGLNN